MIRKQAVTLVGITTALLAGIIPTTLNAFATSPFNAEIVWGNNQLWQMVTPPGHGSAKPAQELYIVAPQTSTPQSPANNDHIPGVAHDHVLAPPPANKGEYNPNWEVYLVLCTQSAISHGTCTPVMSTFPGPGGPGTGPTLPLAYQVNGQPLTSDSAILSAENAGLVTAHDTGIEFLCIVHPLK